MNKAQPRSGSSAPVLWALTALFSLRILGQAVQRWFPVAWLPPFSDFQGSNLPYGVLLSVQLLILAVMIRATWREQHGRLTHRPKLARGLQWLGAIYLAGSVLRLWVGVLVPEAAPWFKAWISGFFHLVLASFVCILARCYASASASADRRVHWWHYAIYPVSVASAFTLFAALSTTGHSLPTALYTSITVNALWVLLLERLLPERADWQPRRSHVQGDALYVVLVQIALPKFFVMGVTLLLALRAHAHAPSTLWPHHWHWVAQTALMVLLVDLVRYWVHRACHHFPMLWRLHEVHHSPRLLYSLNASRFHPVEKALHFAVDTLPYLILGVAAQVLAGYFLVYAVNGFYQHSNIRLRYGLLNYFIGSAETHRWHHARDPKLASCNFSSTTLIWDLVFGTWYLPKRPVDAIGIQDDTYPTGFWRQMVVPFRSCMRLKQILAQLALEARLCATALQAFWRLRRQLRAPQDVQDTLLRQILRANRNTVFGLERDFANIKSYERFRSLVPVYDFEALRPYIVQQQVTGATALTAERPLCYLRTSGTTSEPKDIPLTETHLRSLRALQRFAVARQWVLARDAFKGSILAVTGPAREGVLPNGKSYGAASGVVAASTPQLVRDKFIVTPEVLSIADSHVKYLLILRLALARSDITYFAIANPTTLLTLAKLYRDNEVELISDLRRGGFFLAQRVPPEVYRRVQKQLLPSVARADELSALQATHTPRHLRDVWPNVRLVVCWTCGSAGIAARALRDELPTQTRILELGYIASEFRGTVTIGRRSGSGLPTLDAHFFEFVARDLWDRGELEYLTISQLRKGAEYYVIVTTPSGLYRYFINDVVRVTGFLHATPLLRFVQKGKGVTNITGEKLYESQVITAVTAVLKRYQISSRFYIVLADEERYHYSLYMECTADAKPAMEEFSHSIDTQLRTLNIEFHAKRESNRLRPLRGYWLQPGTYDMYKQHSIAKGQRESQFKPPVLAYMKQVGFGFEAFRLP